MLTVSLTPPEESALVATAQAHMNSVTALTIVTADDYTSASSELAAIKGKAKELDELRKGIVKPLDEARQKIQDLFRRPLALLEDAEKKLKGAMIVYQADQERKRKEEQARIDELARKERARLEAEAAAIRAKAEQQAAEARRKAALAEEVRRRAEAEGRAAAAAAAAAQVAKLNAQAAAQETAGIERAQEFSTIAELVVAPTVATEVPKVAGQSTRKVWKGRVKEPFNPNWLKVLAYIVAHPQYANLAEPNGQAFDKLAKALEQNFSIDGAEAYTETVLASRSA